MHIFMVSSTALRTVIYSILGTKTWRNGTRDQSDSLVRGGLLRRNVKDPLDAAGPHHELQLSVSRCITPAPFPLTRAS